MKSSVNEYVNILFFGRAASQMWCGMAGLGCKGSEVQILGETPFLKVSVSNKTVYIQTCWVRVNMIIPLNLENVYLFTYLLPLVLLTDEREDIQKKTFTKWVNAQLAKVRQLYFHSAFNSV